MALHKFDRGLYRNGNKAKGLSYGQIEPNQVWFDRAGMVEAQCKLSTDQFSDTQVAPNTVFTAESAPGAGDAVKIVAQNGAFLMVNKAKYRAEVPTQAGKDAGFRVGINYSSEKLYNQFAPQRRNFFLTTQDWLPRIGYVEAGNRITTNTVQWDDTGATVEGADAAGNAVTLTVADFTDTNNQTDSYALFTAIKNYINQDVTGTPIYAAVIDGSDGELVILGGEKPEEENYIVLAQVVAAYDNADRTCSFMFQIIDGGTK